MAFAEERVSAEGYFRVQVTGVAEPGWPASIKEILAKRLRECQQEGLSGCMFDIRGLELRMGIMDLYDLGVTLANLSVPGIRVAVLAEPKQILPDRFFQSVASNRGAIVFVFSAEEEALRWLTVRAAAPGAGQPVAPGRTASPVTPGSPGAAPGPQPGAGAPKAPVPPQADRPTPPPRPPGRDTL
jgi:hypothetical protein